MDENILDMLRFAVLVWCRIEIIVMITSKGLKKNKGFLKKQSKAQFLNLQIKPY